MVTTLPVKATSAVRLLPEKSDARVDRRWRAYASQRSGLSRRQCPPGGNVIILAEEVRDREHYVRECLPNCRDVILDGLQSVQITKRVPKSGGNSEDGVSD